MSVTEVEKQVIEEGVAPPAIDWDVKLTYEQTLEGLKALAAERPDYVYKSPLAEDGCLYIHPDGSPGCIVGNLLVRAGVNPALISGFEGRPSIYLPVWADQRAKAFARQAQAQQDARTPWGESVTVAIQSMGHFNA